MKQAIDHPQFDVFDMIGEDAHRHILSYLMCVRDGHAVSPKPASAFIAAEHDSEAAANNPSFSGYQVSERLKKDYEALHPEDKAEWVVFEEQDRKRYRQERDAITTPEELVKICSDLCTISKHWREAVGGQMNSNAPKDIIEPSDLFHLKCRGRDS